MSVRKQIERIRALAAAGDFAGACALGRSVYTKNPANIPLGLIYAQALLGGGDNGAAADVLAKMTGNRKAPADVFLMRAHALMQLRRLDECLETVMSGLKKFPDHPDLLNNAGVLNDMLKRPAGAETCFRQLTRVQPRRGGAYLGLGNALRQQGRYDDALQAYETAVALEPGNPAPQVNRANMLGQMGEGARAQAAYREILQRFPQRKDVLSNFAASLANSGDHAGAAELYESYIESRPDDFDANLSWGKALLKSGNAAAAETVFAAMASAWPDRTGICPELINACLKNGAEALAREYQAMYRVKFPASADVYSCDTILDAASGGRDTALNEVRYDADIQAAEIAVPDGYADGESFWDAVCAAVYAHPSLRESPPEHATREGFHSDNLAEEPVAPALRDLIAAIEDNVRDYAARRADAGNPFFDNLSLEGNLFRMWAVVMRRGGHQEAHIHPSSRISGVVYAKVPPSIRDGNDRSGWIEFGRPHSDFFQPETLATRMFQPKRGRMVMFPAYLYHRTLPLDGDDHRISIAFDFCTPGA
ncbi:MAG: putative 2OG-Fe(II) oxygenase [Alphaproteobacteria bacterium]